MSCCVSSLVTVLGTPVGEWLLCLAVFQDWWQCLSLALQSVSGSCVLLCFKPGDNFCPWLSRKWVAVVPCCVSSLVTMPVLGSPACEWLLWLAFKPANYDCPWLSRKWVAAMCCYLLSSLVMHVLGSSVGKWLLCLGVFQVQWQWLFWFFSWWVAAVSCCVSSMVTMLVLGSPVGEWLLCIVVFQAWWQFLFLALQEVSNSCALMCFKPSDYACPWLSRKWVPAVPCCVSSMVTMPVLGFSLWVATVPCCFLSLVTMLVFGPSVCEWLLCLAVFQA